MARERRLNAPVALQAETPAATGKLGFVLVGVFIDVLGIGLIIPVMPLLVGQFVPGRDEQALWYGLMAAVLGLLQFLFMPTLGAISDRVGRRPVLLYSMAGMCLNFLVTAWGRTYSSREEEVDDDAWQAGARREEAAWRAMQRRATQHPLVRRVSNDSSLLG